MANYKQWKLKLALKMARLLVETSYYVHKYTIILKCMCWLLMHFTKRQ